ncbi:metallophosphoesterase family protein [Bacillus carboniphilus]|uniref:Metallophosphoesterase family protein n=1 Tax=Bacillus carboniphilus TaxID=86663 RepID=A0ABY9JS24_9BACI|nr:metallophosphoesterase family protein [Bacillus carboniphilus]WLR42205.1 metallophosphoesterase family protein [Bacillus carboniphilus]
MKIAIITDVHGNAPALKAVLEELDRREEIEHIYCLGDMIGIGPDTNEVLNLLFSRNDLSMMTGNHDEAIIALSKGQIYPKSHAHCREHHQWIADRLDETFLVKLAELPRTIKTTINNFSIRFIHYSIPKGKEEDPISNDPFAPIVDPNLQNIEKLFSHYCEDLIAFGHHHPIHNFKGEKTYYVNPGSLGCNHRPTAPFSTVHIENGKIDVSFEEVSYDNSDFFKSYHQLQVPDREFILKVFHGNQL